MTAIDGSVAGVATSFLMMALCRAARTAATAEIVPAVTDPKAVVNAATSMAFMLAG